MITLGLTWQLARDPLHLLRGRVVGLEVGIAAAIQFADGFVHLQPHVFTARQPLGVASPLAWILASGVAFGPAVGVSTGVGLGLARTVSSLAKVTPASEPWIGPLSPVVRPEGPIHRRRAPSGRQPLRGPRRDPGRGEAAR